MEIEAKKWRKIINWALLIMTAILTYLNLRDRFAGKEKDGISITPPAQHGEALYRNMPPEVREFVDRMTAKAREQSGIQGITTPQIIDELINRGHLILSTSKAATAEKAAA